MDLSGRRGFTLIEILIVVAIIGTLLLIFIPKEKNIISNANTSKLQQNGKKIEDAISSYYIENDSFPVSGNITASVSQKTKDIINQELTARGSVSTYNDLKNNNMLKIIDGIKLSKFLKQNNIETSNYFVVTSTELKGFVFSYTTLQNKKGVEFSGNYALSSNPVSNPSADATVRLPSSGNGTVGNPYVITTIGELQAVDLCLSCSYILGNDIDATSFDYGDGKGFKPIGLTLGSFTGTFSGNNHKVIGLKINRPLDDNIGLFSRVRQGTIQKVGLENVNITGKTMVGGISGYFWQNTIQEVYVTGSVTGIDEVGGLSGGADETNTLNNYSRASVTANAGASEVGGLIAVAYSAVNPDHSNNYATGVVTNGYGLVGSTSDPFFSNYWDTQTSGQAFSASGTGKTTTQMKSQGTYTGWDFTNIWAINPAINNGYPYLKNNVPN